MESLFAPCADTHRHLKRLRTHPYQPHPNSKFLLAPFRRVAVGMEPIVDHIPMIEGCAALVWFRSLALVKQIADVVNIVRRFVLQFAPVIIF